MSCHCGPGVLSQFTVLRVAAEARLHDHPIVPEINDSGVLKPTGKTLWVVVDGGYTQVPFLRRATIERKKRDLVEFLRCL